MRDNLNFAEKLHGNGDIVNSKLSTGNEKCY